MYALQKCEIMSLCHDPLSQTSFSLHMHTETCHEVYYSEWFSVLQEINVTSVH